jgi:hypothetical protein
VILNKAPAAEMMDPMPVRARLLSAWRSTPTEPFKSFWFRIDAPYVVKESRGEKEKYLARIEEEFHFAGEHLVEVVLDVAQVGVSGVGAAIGDEELHPVAMRTFMHGPERGGQFRRLLFQDVTQRLRLVFRVIWAPIGAWRGETVFRLIVHDGSTKSKPRI